MKNLPQSDMMEKSSVAGTGNGKIVLSKWIAESGMLIEYLYEEFPNWAELGEQTIGDLQVLKVKFDNDPAFKKRAQDFRYRLNEEKAQWIIYVTDVGQSDHFEFLFSAAKRAGWIPIDNGVPYAKASHVGLRLVHGNERKHFRTLSSEVVCLVDLLDEALNRSKQKLIYFGKMNGRLKNMRMQQKQSHMEH